MAQEDDIHNALLAIHSRLDIIEGKVTVVARADRDKLLVELEKVVRKDPVVGKIYLTLDGQKNQEQLRAELGIGAASMSRWLRKMSRTHGIIELVPGREAGKVYRHDPDMEDVLDLSRCMERWLADIEKTSMRAATKPKRAR